MDTSNTELSYLKSDEPIPLEWRELFSRNARPMYARKAQIVVSQGDQSSDVFFISKGRVQFSILSKNGREAIFDELGEGYMFGELSALDMYPRSVSVTTIEDCEFLQISGEKFRSFLYSTPGAGLWMAQKLALRLRYLTEKTFELATMSVSTRLQVELLRLSQGNDVEGDLGIIDPLPTHSALAARIGSHREAVTRELRQLTEEGIVKQSGRQLQILSIQNLQKLLSRTK